MSSSTTSQEISSLEYSRSGSSHQSKRWRDREKKPNPYKRIIWILLFLAIVAGAMMAVSRIMRKRPTVYGTKPVTRGDIRQEVDTTGTIEAVTRVQIGSQVSGTISRIYVDFNSRVRKGQLIAEIDPSVYEGQVLQAQANLDQAQANLETAQANLANTRAKAVQARADYERIAALGESGIFSPQQVDAARAAADSADAQVRAGNSQIKESTAAVTQREAALAVAKTNLAYTKIYAPIDGTVIQRAVDVGQTVASSFQTPTLFTIAQDLTRMQVQVSTDEGDVGHIQVGQPVTFRVDAFPDRTFNGQVSQVRMNATTVQNVVTYETIVDFANPDHKLFPGMTAYVTVPVASANNVLRVPNAALRYQPNLSRERLAERLKQNGIEVPDTTPKAALSGPKSAMVWKLLPDKTIQPVLIRPGITDHMNTAVTEVLKGILSANDALVTDETQPGSGLLPSRPGGGS